MMNINCSTCLESFTSGCDISTTPCGHVFHTGCITRWLNQNDHCSQCREVCEIRQIIKLYFSESQCAIEENITINDLEQKSIKLEEKSLKCERDITAMKKVVLNQEIEINQVNQKCKKLEHEKLLMKLDWSKTESNLKESTIEAYIRIEDLEKEVEEQKMMKLDLIGNLKHTINRLTKRIKDLEKEVDDQKWLWLESNTEPAELEVKRPCIAACNPKHSDLSPSPTNKGNKPFKDLEKQGSDQKMVDKTNSGLESKADETEGAPPTQKRNHKDYLEMSDEENIGKVIDSILDILIATLERLRIGIKSSSVLYIYCKDLWECLNILSNPLYYAIYALNCDKLEEWLILLQLLATDDKQITDEQVSEMKIDFNDALKKLSINNVLEVTK